MDSIFSNFGELNEGDVLEDKLVYLKKNEITKIGRKIKPMVQQGSSILL